MLSLWIIAFQGKMRQEKMFLTESNKSPGSISKSNNQGNLLASGEVQAPSDELRSTYSVMSK